MTTQKYVKRILIIICLTNIPAILLLPALPMSALSWFLGSFASAVNFYFLAKNANESVSFLEEKAKVNSVKGFYLRYLLLITYSVIVCLLLNIKIIAFGVGLLSAQISIYINEIYEKVKNSKFGDYLRR